MDKPGGPDAIFARRMIFAVGLFWAIHGIYTWINPFPLRTRWPGDTLGSAQFHFSDRN